MSTSESENKSIDDFWVEESRTSQIIIKGADEIQKFNGFWFRSKNINFIPSKKCSRNQKPLKNF